MKALVLSSGGVDSTTALGMAIAKYGKENVIALSISYGQKHDKEIQAASAVAKYYGVEQLFLDLSLIFSYSNSSLLKQSTEEIPEESYAEQIKETGGSKPVSTYVPFRTCGRRGGLRVSRLFTGLQQCDERGDLGGLRPPASN